MCCDAACRVRAHGGLRGSAAEEVDSTTTRQSTRDWHPVSDTSFPASWETAGSGLCCQDCGRRLTDCVQLPGASGAPPPHFHPAAVESRGVSGLGSSPSVLEVSPSLESVGMGLERFDQVRGS